MFLSVISIHSMTFLKRKKNSIFTWVFFNYKLRKIFWFFSDTILSFKMAELVLNLLNLLISSVLYTVICCFVHKNNETKLLSLTSLKRIKYFQCTEKINRNITSSRHKRIKFTINLKRLKWDNSK